MKEIIEVMVAYGDLRVENTELKKDIELLRRELKDTISLADFRKFLYVSSNGEDVWTQSEFKDEIIKILTGE